MKTSPINRVGDLGTSGEMSKFARENLSENKLRPSVSIREQPQTSSDFARAVQELNSLIFPSGAFWTK